MRVEDTSYEVFIHCFTQGGRREDSASGQSPSPVAGIAFQ